MAGWRTSVITPTHQTKGVPTNGTVGAALDTNWGMLYGYTDLGYDINFLTQTPLHVDYNLSTSTSSNETIGAPNAYPFYRYIGDGAPSSASLIRLSARLVNVGGSAEVWFCATDVGTTKRATSVGYIHIDRLNARIGFVWGGQSVYVAFGAGGWHTRDGFRCGIELNGAEASGYYYPYGEPPDTDTTENVNNTKLVLIGTLPRTAPSGATLWPGAQTEFDGEDFHEIWIEYTPGGGGGGVGYPPPFPFNPYGLYKTQLQVHGMLSNARLTQ